MAINYAIECDWFQQWFQRHVEWSNKTFGPGRRTLNLTRHIRNECDEIDANPGDILEPIDVIILAIDMLQRMGYDAHDVMASLISKQIMNFKREWPDWRDAPPDEPIEHIREASGEQPAPAPNHRPPVWEAVIAEMHARDKLGRKRYGTPLQPFNGRDALRDAFEEALDLVVYLKQAMIERSSLQ